MSNSILSGNRGNTDGGGIFNTGGTVNVSYSAFFNNTTLSHGTEDCLYCTSNSNEITSDPKLALLGNYGGTTQTMLPQPGSSAICAGLAADVPSGVTTDQRGFPNTNSTYTSGTCMDAGAVQTNYQSVQFTNVPGGGAYTASTGATPSPAPIVSVTENGQNIGAVPITLTDASLTVTGLGPVTTVAGTGATFSSVQDSAGEDTSLKASLQITPAAISPAFTITASAPFDSTSSITQAALTTPAPNTPTPLTNTSVTFTWNPGNTAAHFEFFVGTTGAGSSNIYNSGSVTATSETVSNLPGNGEKLYMRLYSLINGAWQYTDYTYVASGSPTQAALTTPTPNTSNALSGTSVAFTWTPGNIATHFEFFVGTTRVGSSNLYNSGNVTATTETVSGLPSNGETFYVRLYSLINGAWQYTDYTYVAF
jgi:hypothetical protein